MEDDRPALLELLQSAHEFPWQQVHGYGRRSRSGALVAWRSGELVGVLFGSYRSDLSDNDAFGRFDLPPSPHAWLDRILVRESAREQGVGRALVQEFARETEVRRCTFIGGLVDDATNPRTRELFFENVGFTISPTRVFGASVGDLLAR